MDTHYRAKSFTFTDGADCRKSFSVITLFKAAIARWYAAARRIAFLMLLVSPVLGQQKSVEGAKAEAKATRTLTNDNISIGSSQSSDRLPPIPGAINCGKDLKCFLPSLDKATPAAIKRSETVREGTAVVTMESVWWTSEFAADRCTVSFRVDNLDAKLNEDVVPDDPKAHADVEAKLAEMKRDFESFRGKTETCSMTIRDLRTVMTSSAWSLISLGPASGFGKTCSGPMFNGQKGQRPNDNK
jgi:hypothetical protein